jgi:hypothetical protein
MKKLFLTSFGMFLLFASTILKADEGMWFLMFLEKNNMQDMQKMGLKLTAEQIYSINNSSLKDAIVQFNGGCTGEIISKDGLVLTNHHCGYNVIAELSTPENNYLRDGYWAPNKAAEMKPKSLYVRFFVRMDDVTSRILGVVNESMNELDREAAINKEIAKIQKENDEGGKYTVSVRPFFQGNAYYYFVYQDYTDVRFVGTPTESIGKFGGDKDNWEWPRHTGDFSLFRVYADKDGNPAPYAKDNVPLKPRKHLSVNMGGVKENDFAMILGYPGRTNRWMPANGIDQNVKFAYPAWVEGSKTGMDNMKKHMDKNTKVRLDYASKYASVANYWKNRQGMIDALTFHKTVKAKTAQEVKFNAWANKKENKEKYGNVITDINKYYAMTNEKARHDNYMMTMFRTSTLVSYPSRLGKQLEAYAKADSTKRAEMKPKLVSAIDQVFESMFMPLEVDVLTAQLKLYTTKSTGFAIAPILSNIAKANNNDFTQYVSGLQELSLFANKNRLYAFLEFPSEGMIANDPLYMLSSQMMEHYNAKSDELKKVENDYLKAYRLFVDGLQKSNPAGKFYPDANSTLRLTYGKVRALPKDSRNDAKVNFYTTLDGMVAKHKPGDPEFDLSQPLIDLYNKKDYGRYADKAGYLPVNFLTDNDITGGNSGSPVLNGKGELIGLAFDGNIEAMAGDVIFDKNLQRTINVDIRFVLYIIDKYAGAKHIIDELTIVE